MKCRYCKARIQENNTGELTAIKWVHVREDDKDTITTWWCVPGRKPHEPEPKTEIINEFYS